MYVKKPASLRWADLEDSDSEGEYQRRSNAPHVGVGETNAAIIATRVRANIFSPLSYVQDNTSFRNAEAASEVYHSRVRLLIALGAKSLHAEREAFRLSSFKHARGKKTTLFLSSLPRHFGKYQLFAFINSLGFAGAYDFIYVPFDFKTRKSTGFGFINFKDNLHAIGAIQVLNTIPLAVEWCKNFQGLAACVRNFKRSAICLNPYVGSELKPSVLRQDDGVPVEWVTLAALRYAGGARAAYI